jgi:uncharacterized membrane protein HdeD (DUF308 family)
MDLALWLCSITSEPSNQPIAVIGVVLFFVLRQYRHAAWILVDGIVTLILGILLCAHWPPAMLDIVQDLVGIGFILSGVSRVLIGLTIREIGPTEAPVT